ncbi:MAG: SDR family NAD(P)-dependent oxidoreductase [Eubacteriales bacterium]|nr:SDR family NAD(P)-dependent oxidoreductase [Eubacteriales bacterium]MDD4583423.1 SDR family NAD(P)-dependent oxidoreductase [Eubacteriales bacterium]
MRVVITGGTSGIGKSAVALFIKEGWQVMFVGTNQDVGQSMLSEFHSQGYKEIYFCKCDITKDQDVKRLFDYTMEKMGGTDSLINNAGIFISGMLHETKEEDWNRIFDVDVKSIYLTSKYFIPYMIKNKGGTIVNTASVSGMLGDYNMAAYNAAKGAVVNLVRAMALDYGKFGIRVNNVCPSACATPMFLANDEETIRAFNDANPIKRICTPDEVAQAMLFLASDRSSSCNGVNLQVSGGLDIHTGQPVQE